MHSEKPSVNSPAHPIRTVQELTPAVYFYPGQTRNEHPSSHIEFLASDDALEGRMTGSKGAAQAAEHIATQFAHNLISSRSVINRQPTFKNLNSQREDDS